MRIYTKRRVKQYRWEEDTSQILYLKYNFSSLCWVSRWVLDWILTWMDSACRRIIFVFLLVWDPCTLSFPGLYQVPEANPYIPYCLLKIKTIHLKLLKYYSSVSEPYLRAQAIFPMWLGPAALCTGVAPTTSSISHFCSTLHRCLW